MYHGGQAPPSPSSLDTLHRRSHLIGGDLEVDQAGIAERCGDGNIRGVPARSHQHAPDARFVISRIESPPAVFKVNLEPRAEVHRSIGEWDADVSQISSRIARWNIQRPAERNRQVLKVPAHSPPFPVHVERGFCGAGKLIAESDILVYPVTDSLHPLPPRRDASEQLGRGVR